MEKKLLLSLVMGVVLMPGFLNSARRGAATAAAAAGGEMQASQGAVASRGAATRRPALATTRRAATRRAFVSEPSQAVSPEVKDAESALMDHLRHVEDLISTMTVVSEEAKALIGKINLAVNGPVAMPAMTKPMLVQMTPPPAAEPEVTVAETLAEEITT